LGVDENVSAGQGFKKTLTLALSLKERGLEAAYFVVLSLSLRERAG
jgi:hypothetical protein